MKTIPTIYKGISFRSKLEAQWAKFFDAEKIAYIYEPEGYEFKDGTRYLPDFYLPDAHQYFEVKGVMKKIDLHKIKTLIKESGKAVVIGYGDGAFCACNWWDTEYELAISTGCPAEDCFASALVQCKKCKKKWFMGTAGWWKCPCCGEYGEHLTKWRYSQDLNWYEKAQIDVVNGSKEEACQR